MDNVLQPPIQEGVGSSEVAGMGRPEPLPRDLPRRILSRSEEMARTSQAGVGTKGAPEPI